MLQTGGLIRDLTVRELVTMVASLYPAPLAVDEVLDAGRHRRDRGSADAEAVRRRDAARALRARARVANPELLVLDEPTVAMDVEGAPRVLDDDARVRGAREDRALRDALPRGGRRVRRPRGADGARARRRRRADHRDQGAWSARARSARRCPAPTSTSSPQLPGVDERRAPRRGGRAALRRLRRGDPGAARRVPAGPRHRDRRRRPRGGVPRADRDDDPDQEEAAR